MRTGTPCGAGSLVRPASESVTEKCSRAANAPASARASLVPPRTRMRCMAERQSGERGALPLPIGERIGVRGLQPYREGVTPHPNPLPMGEGTAPSLSLDQLPTRSTGAEQRWLSIVGIGEDGISGLSPGARALVNGAEIVFGG